jgi:hypothetical protein
MLFVTLPGGSRGSVILLVAASLFADLYAWLVIKRSFFKSFFTFTNLSLVVIAIYCAFMLTSMRSTNYASISNAVDDAISFKMDSGLEKYGEDETDLMMRDYYYVVDKWGSRYEYLPFLYSVGTIVFNPIPRFLWQNKPVSFGRILSTSQAGGDIKSVKYMIDNVKTSAAVGVCGEGWANGGVLGVVFYSIIFGALSGIATKLAMTLFYKPGYISLAIAFFLWKVPSSWVRGDLTGLLQALSPLLLFTLILYVFSKKKLSYKS